MCKEWIASGLDPARFWGITPRLYMIEMEGAVERARRARELVWFTAMLPYLKEKQTLAQFTGVEAKAKPKLPDWRDELSRWQAYAARKH
jgi:hypothetical protein